MRFSQFLLLEDFLALLSYCYTYSFCFTVIKKLRQMWGLLLCCL